MVMRVEVIKAFINQQEIAELNAWAETGVKNKWLDVAISRGQVCKNRLTTRFYGQRFLYPKVAHEIHDRIRARFGFESAPLVDGHGRDGIVVSYTMHGGDVFAHKDPRSLPELAVLRCNLVSQLPEEGGKLFVGDEQVGIGAGDLHCYLASEYEHYVTEVKGKTPRILWMFGACVPVNKWELK